MSTPKKEARVKVVVGSVIRRPAAEVLEEMADLARQDRKKISTPIPPAPRPQTGRFSIVRRPPLPRHQPINPYTPPSPERDEDRLLRVEAAAMSARAHEEGERYLLSMADEIAARPRSPSPRRDEEDHYDLAKWNRKRWK